MRLRPSFLFVLAPIAMVIVALGCMPGTDVGDGDGDGDNGNGADSLLCDDGCYNQNPECAPDLIAQDGDERCAECGDRSICGPLARAECVEREDAVGNPCQHCRDVSGDVVYSDCAVATNDAFVCEPVASDDPALTCEACFDDEGSIVSAECRPEVDDCRVEIVGGVECEVCTLNGDFAFQTCPNVNIDPVSCVTYGDDSASCTDCVNADGELVLHSCAQASNNDICSDFTTIDGLACTVCTDVNGIATSSQCVPNAPQPEFCEELVYTEQTCTVCVGAAGNLVSSQCARNNCDEPGVNCAAPPPCQSFTDDNGSLCRVCELESRPGETETRCVGDPSPNLQCTIEARGVGGPDGIVGEEDCLVCFYAGDFIYEICESDGPLESPVCLGSSSGEECTECFEPLGGLIIYSTCGGVVCNSAFDQQGNLCEECVDVETNTVVSFDCDQCVREDNLQPTSPNGEPVPPVSANPDGALSCVSCTTTENLPEVTCISNVTCDGSLLNDALQDATECPGDALYVRGVVFCDEPWGQFAPGIDRTLAAAGWLSLSEIDYRAVQFTPQEVGENCTACGCPAGESLQIITTQDDAQHDVLVDLGFEFVELANSP